MKKWTKILLRIVTLTLFLLPGILACNNNSGPGFGPSIDIASPTVSIESHSNDQYIRSSLTLSGSVVEDQGLASVVIKFDSTVLGATITPTANLTVYNWSVTFDSASYPQGVKDVLVTATDIYGKTGSQKVLLNFDNQAPIVLINTPTVVTDLNGNVGIKGETADNYRITAVRMTLLDAADNPILDGVTVSGTQSWYYTLDSRNLGGSVLNGTYRLMVEAEDIAGNVSDTTFYKITLNASPGDAGDANVDDLYKIYYGGTVSGLILNRVDLDALKLNSNILTMDINQDADLPEIHATYPSWSGSNADNAMTGSSLATGQVIDDDGVDTNRIYYMIDGTAPDFADDAKWTPVDSVTSTGSWNFAIATAQDVNGNPVGEGNHTLNLKAYDLDGTFRIFSEQNGAPIDFAIDSGSPVYTAGPFPIIGDYFNDNFHVTGSVADGAGIDQVRIRFGGALVKTYFHDDILADDPESDQDLTFSFDYSVNIDTSGTHNDDGSKVIVIEVEDVGGRVNQKEILVNIDTEDPSVSLQSPSAGSTVNGVFNVIGSGSDNARINTLEYYLSTTVLDAADIQDIDDNDSWLNDFNSGSDGYNWAKTIDSLTYHTASGPLYLYIHATDVAGNSSTTSLDFDIDQSADKPEFIFGNLDEDAVLATDNALDASAQISGTISDDDGIEATSIQFRITDAVNAELLAWTNVSTQPANNGLNETWRQDLTSPVVTGAGVSEGEFKIQFRAHDNEVSDYSNPNKMVETPLIPFAIDSNPPTIDSVSPASGSYTNASTFIVEGTASDYMGIKDITVDVSGLTIPAPVVTGTENWSIELDLSGAASGTLKLKIYATDNADKKGTFETQYTIDRSAPVIDFIGPDKDSDTDTDFIIDTVQNGIITFQAEATDDILLSNVYYQIHTSASPVAFADTDENGIDDNGNWIKLTNITELVSGVQIDTTALGTAGDDTLYVSVRAADRAANDLVETYDFTINQESDRPSVSFISLDGGAATALDQIIDGASAVSGKVTDDDGVSASSVQYAIVATGAAAPLDGAYADVTGQPSSNSVEAAWSHDISGLTTGEYDLYIRAFDITSGASYDPANNSVSVVSSPVHFAIDTDAPLLAIDNYATLNNSYVNSDFTVSGTLTDDLKTGTAEIIVGSRVAAPLTLNGASQTSKTWTADIDLDLNNDGILDAGDIPDGELSIVVNAEDQFGRAVTKQLFVNIDTEDPVYGDLSPVSGSSVNGTFTISGTSSDNDKVSSVELYTTKPAVNVSVGSIVGTTLTGMTGSTSSWKADVDINTYDEVTYGTRPGMDFTVNTLALLKAESASEGDYGEVTADGGNNGFYYYNGAMWVSADPWIVPFELIVTDRAGNSVSSAFSLLLDQGTDTPVVSLSNMDPDAPAPALYTDDNMLQSVLALLGSVIDDDGISAGDIEISYDYDGTNEGAAVWTSVNASDAGTSYSLNYDLSGLTSLSSGDQGDGTLSLRIRDENYIDDTATPFNEIIIGPVNFAIDTDPPVITLDGSSEISQGDYLKAGDVRNIAFTVTEKNFGNTTPTVEGNNASGGPVYTYSVDADDVDLNDGPGVKEYILSATDNYGKTTTKTISFTVDVDPPVININNLAENQTLNGPSYKVMGSIDENYGFASSSPVQVNIDGTGPVDVDSGTYSWNYTFLMDSLLPGDESELADLGGTGTYPLVVTAEDKAGNTASATVNFTIDQEADRPSAEITNLGGAESDYQQTQISTSHADNEDVLVGILYSDSIINTGNITVEIDLDGNSVFDPSDDVTSDVVFAGSGNVVAFYLSMVDDAVYPDLTLADISITSSDAGVTPLYDVVGNNVVVLNDSSRIIGLAIDDDALASEILEISGTEELNVSDTSTSYNLNFAVGSISEGIHLARFSVEDENGITNSSNTLFIKDVTAPVITIASPSQGAYINDEVSTTGSVTDGFALRSLSIAANDVGGSQLVDFGVMDLADPLFVQTDSQNWSWDFTLEALDDSYSSEIVTLKYESLDIAGHESTAERTVTIDNAAPSISINSPSVSDKVNGAISIKGSSSDNAVDTVEVRLGVFYDDDADASTPNIPVTHDHDGNAGTAQVEKASTWMAPVGTYNWSLDFAQIDNYANALYADPNGFAIDASFDTLQDANDAGPVPGEIYYIRNTADPSSPFTLIANGSGQLEQYLGQWNTTIQVRVTDKAGNITVEEQTLQIDSNTDRPKVNVLQPSTVTSKQGGTVYLFGNATDDDGVDHVQVYIDLNNDGDFDDSIDIWDGTDVSSDGDTDDAFEVEADGETATGTNSWSIEFNTAGEMYDGTFASLGGTINIQVISYDINGKPSEPETRTIELDKTVPVVEGLSVNSGDYRNGVFAFHADITDDATGGVKQVDISYDNGSTFETIYETNIDASSVNYNNGSITRNSAIDLDLDINVDTTTPGADSYIASSDVLYMVVKVVDTSNYPTLKYIYVNVDNEEPSGNLLQGQTEIFNLYDIEGTDARIYGEAVDSGTVNGLKRVVVYFTDGAGNVYDVNDTTQTASIAVPDVDGSIPDYLEVLGENDYTTPGSEAVYALVLDDMNEYGDDTWDGDDTNGTQDGDSDLFNEYITQAAGGTDWWIEFDSNNLPDGDITVKYAVEDNAGNFTEYSAQGLIANSKPRFNVIRLGDDFDLSGGITAGELFDYETGSSPTLVEQLQIDIETDLNCIYTVYHTEIDPLNIIDTQNTAGTNTYSLALNNAVFDADYTNGPHTFFIRAEAEDTGVVSIQQIQFIKSSEDTIAPELQLFELEKTYTDNGKVHIADHIDGVTLYNSNNEEISRDVSNMNYHDQVRPVLAAPEANTEGTYQGHLELLDDVGDGDADVSGIVTLSGYAYDNRAIMAIVADIDYFDAGASYDINQGAGTAYETKVLAYWDPASGLVANDLGDFATTGEAFTIETATGDNPLRYSSQRMNQDGHLVYWSYTFDTSRITGVAAEDVNIQIRALDFYADLTQAEGSTGNISPLEASADVEGDGWMTIDIVPYITSVKRSSSYTTLRSKNGYYPVRREETGMILNGYNMGVYGGAGADTNPVITVSGNKTASDAVGTDGTHFVTMTNVDMTSDTSLTFTVPDNALSGWLRLYINGVESNNNYNSNGTVYNDESMDSNVYSSLWNDDRYFHVWQSNARTNYDENNGYFEGSDNPVYPAMTLDGTGVLYASWSDYTSSTLYYNQNDASGRNTVYGTYDPMEHNDIAMGTDGPYVAYNGNYMPGSFSNDSGGVEFWETNGNNRRYQLEELNNDDMLMQFINQRVAANGDEAHITYYDTETKALKYNYVNTESNSSSHWVNIDGGYDNHDENNTVNVDMNGTPDNPLDDTVNAARSSAAGQYSAVDVLSNGRPVIAYYDIDNQTVKLAVGSDSNPDASEWTVMTVMDNSTADGDGVDPNFEFSGKYISMKVDSDDNVHMAFFRSSTGDLVYIKSTDNPVTGSSFVFDVDSVVVDDNGSVGSWADISLNGTLPVISYLDSSRVNTFSGLKMAYYDGSDWEYMNAPLGYAVDDVRTSVEYDVANRNNTQNNTTGEINWEYAIGYASDYYRIAYYIPEAIPAP